MSVAGVRVVEFGTYCTCMDLGLSYRQCKCLDNRYSVAYTSRNGDLSLYHNCDSTTIRRRHDYDEKLTCSFFARVESR